LFHAMCGRPPFTSDHGTGLLIAAHIRDQPPDTRQLAQVPEAIAAIVARLLQKEPSARFPSATELRAALVAAGAPAPATRAVAAPEATPDAYAATLAPGIVCAATGAPQTTNGAAAAQVLPTAPRRSRGSWFVVCGAVLAIGGVGVGVAVSHSADDTRSQAAAPTLPPATSALAPRSTGATLPNQTATATGAVTPLPSPAPGPRVPAVATETRSTPPASQTPLHPLPHHGSRSDTKLSFPSDTLTPSGNAPNFSLDKKTYDPGTPITIHFTSPLTSPSNSRAWVTTVESSAAPDQFGDWSYVADHATSATLTAPNTPGSYQVRLHTDYPTHTTNLRRAINFTVGQAPAAPGETPRAQQRFSLAAASFTAGQKIQVTFPVAVVAAKGEQFWITTAKAGDADTEYGKWEYVPAAAKSLMLELPSEPGDYEVRLHANYPTRSTNVVFRARVQLQ
jgi:hypothetical protein